MGKETDTANQDDQDLNPGGPSDDGTGESQSSDEQNTIAKDQYEAVKNQLSDALRQRNKFKTKANELETKLADISLRLEDIERKREDEAGDINAKLERAEREKQRLVDVVKQRDNVIDQRVKRAEIQRIAIAAGCLPDALEDFVTIVAPRVKTKIDDDGDTVFDVGPEYDDLAHLVKRSLETRPHMRASQRKGGTGDSGDAGDDRRSTQSDSNNGLPKDFGNWSSERRREWASNNEEARRAALKKMPLI